MANKRPRFSLKKKVDYASDLPMVWSLEKCSKVIWNNELEYNILGFDDKEYIKIRVGKE